MDSAMNIIDEIKALAAGEQEIGAILASYLGK